MCRRNAYYGQPMVIDELLYHTEHGLIDQSLHARQGVETTETGVWVEVPESTALIIQPGGDEHRPFRPQAPAEAETVTSQ